MSDLVGETMKLGEAIDVRRPNRFMEVGDLSVRERQLVGLVSQGKPNKVIAFEMGLQPGTIKQYMHRVFRKLGTGNRTELAVMALAQSANNTQSDVNV